jgi:hypothetical protein
MNSAILGDSPIMLILANHLKKKENITIYSDKKNIGGAWSYVKFNKVNISRQTNVVVPVDKKVEKLQHKINNSLLKYKIKIKKAQGFHKPNAHLSNKNFRYDFIKLFESRKKFNVIKKLIKKISVYKDFIKIGSTKYDKVYIPYFNGIKKITIKDIEHDIPPRVINSKHILLIFKKLPIDEFVYTENFDDVFDRAQITKFKKFIAFTARVRLENKKSDLNSLLKKSKIYKFTNPNNLLFSNIMRYKNYFRNSDDIQKLKSICKNKNIRIIDTFQFFEAYIDLNKKYLKHF